MNYIVLYILISIVYVGTLAGVYYFLTSKYRQIIADKEDEFDRREKLIRQDAIKRSKSVTLGKTIEHFAPFFKDFPVDAEDVTFLGMPIDYVGFTNTNSKLKSEVHFIEIKSGKSQLSRKQQNIKEAIINGRVYFHEMSIDVG